MTESTRIVLPLPLPLGQRVAVLLHKMLVEILLNMDEQLGLDYFWLSATYHIPKDWLSHHRRPPSNTTP